MSLTVKVAATHADFSSCAAPGAGGYGAPGKRSAQALADDLASGKFSPAYLKRHYGYSPEEG